MTGLVCTVNLQDGSALSVSGWATSPTSATCAHISIGRPSWAYSPRKVPGTQTTTPRAAAQAALEVETSMVQLQVATDTLQAMHSPMPTLKLHSWLDDMTLSKTLRY